jgi:hypothetical protein
MIDVTQENDSAPWDLILRLMFKGTVLDVLAATPPANSGLQTPTPVKQISPPTADDYRAMKALGEHAAQAQDEIAAIMGPIADQLKHLKDQLMEPIAGQLAAAEEKLDQAKNQLLEKMLSHGTKNLRLDDRAPIEVVTSKTKDLTRKELERVIGDKKESMRIWDQVTVKEKHSLKIPAQRPPEN